MINESRTKMNRCHVWGFMWLVALFALPADAQSNKKADTWPWRQFIESDFPFFSTTLDARSKIGGPGDNDLVPRTMVFPLEGDCFLAYDIDLLRVVAVWTAGELPFVNANMAVNSYPYKFNKVGPGTDALPQPKGEIWFRNGIYVGVGTGSPQIVDPRPELPARELVTRGGIDPDLARFIGVDLHRGVLIEYEIGGVNVRERFSHEPEGLFRHLRVSAHQEPIYVVLAKESDAIEFECRGGAIKSVDNHVVCWIEPSDEPHNVSVSCSRVAVSANRRLVAQPPESKSTNASDTRWKQVVRLPLSAIRSDGVLNLEEIPLPLENPYGRAVRPADVNFFADGRAALVTYDGDVWICNGLQPGSREIVWRRFASGLHEPLSIRIRDEEIFVFDRSGLWRLLDRDLNGEADYHELFCSRIQQSAETREFPLSLELQNDGSFLVSKPGQMGTFSAILRISPDGGEVRLIASGFRQPYLGYDPVSGQIAATDQQGNWVPSSPVHFIKQDGFYGFRRSETLDDLPVTPPLTWIPHAECGSATSVVWMRNAKMGPLNDKPVLLCYHPPRLMQVHTDIDDEATQGGVTPLDLSIGSRPLLKATINSSDGLLYLTGFKIWGNSAEEATFFARVRHNSSQPWTIPSQTQVARRGILLRFEQPLQAEFVKRREAYTVRRWNYKRTSAYGSGHYRLDGTAGTETLGVSSAKISKDRKSVFLGIPEMRKVMQIEVSYDLELEDGTPFRRQTFLTAHALRELDLTKFGFSDNEVDLSKRPLLAKEMSNVKPTIQRGALLYRQVGCIGCHSVDGSLSGKNGPSWLGLYGSERKLTKSGELVRANDAYLRESILNPSAKIAEGAVNGEAGMPVYAGVLDDNQVDSLLLFIKALADEDAASSLVQRGPNAMESRDWHVKDFRDELRGPMKGRSFEQGKMVFLGASCFSCHQIGEGKGGSLGPDLSKLDEKMRGTELLRHILEPSWKIDDKYKSRSILTLDGNIHKGFVISENKKEIRIANDPLSDRPPMVIKKSEIDQVKLSNLSPMPIGALNLFDQLQILDLLAYIESRGNAEHPAFNP